MIGWKAAAKSFGYPSTSNRLSTVTQGTTTERAFTYDASGNVTQDTRGSTAYHFTYNNAGRPSALTIGTTARAAYVYDALERLVVRTLQNTSPSGTSHMIYDAAGHLLAETNGAGVDVREYIWLGDRPLGVIDQAETATPKLYQVHTDHLNRPFMMTDASKAVVWQAYYKPFGETWSITGSASLDLRFPGQWFQLEDGLAYNWYRHYDPSIGRYLQVDPLSALVTGLDRYGYAISNPQMNVDADGRQAQVAPCYFGPLPCAAALTATAIVVSVVWLCTPKKRDMPAIYAPPAPPSGQCVCNCRAGDPENASSYRFAVATDKTCRAAAIESCRIAGERSATQNRHHSQALCSDGNRYSGSGSIAQ
jgi:RHS repeat-associated protein